MAVLLVVLYHFRIPGATLRRLVGGWCGVDLFFVLSGFLITGLLLEECEAHGRIDLAAFYRRRWRRLGPALVAMVAAGEVATAFLTWPGAGPYGIGARLKDLGALLSLGINWWQVFGLHSGPQCAALWSLAVEEQFYLVWPLAVAWAYRRRGPGSARSTLAIGAAALAAGSAVECVLLYGGHHDQVRIYFGTDTRAQGLLAGALAALIWHSGRRLHRRSCAWLAAAGSLAVADIAGRVSDTNPFQVNGAFTLLAVSTTAIVLYVVWYPDSALGRILAWRPLRWCGSRSYAIYLWHVPIAMLLYTAGPGTTGAPRWGWPGYLGGMALSLALAEASWLLIERRRPRPPSGSPRHLRPRAARPAAPVPS